MPSTINDATRIIDLTVGQLEDLTRAWVRSEVASAKGTSEDRPNKTYVYGLKGLARIIGCSITTACKINTSGVVDAARTRMGKLLIYDADLVMELVNKADK